MNQYFYKNKMYFIGKIDEIQAALKKAASQCNTLKEFIEMNLN